MRVDNSPNAEAGWPSERDRVSRRSTIAASADFLAAPTDD
jgi:hypothetical protein